MERARGSSALKAAVDAECEVAKDDSGNVRIKFTKMKDAEIPQDMLLQLKGVELPGVLDEDGQPVTSAVLEPAGDLILSTVTQRTDGTKILAKDVMVVLARGWLSDRKLAEALTCGRRQAERAIKALASFNYIDLEKKLVTQEGREALSRVGHEVTQTHKPIYQREDREP
jgi:hypothetical protein